MIFRETGQKTLFSASHLYTAQWKCLQNPFLLSAPFYIKILFLINLQWVADSSIFDLFPCFCYIFSRYMWSDHTLSFRIQMPYAKLSTLPVKLTVPPFLNMEYESNLKKRKYVRKECSVLKVIFNSSRRKSCCLFLLPELTVFRIPSQAVLLPCHIFPANSASAY